MHPHTISLPYVELYYDESSGYLLGAEIYNLDIGDITSMMTIADAEWQGVMQNFHIVEKSLRKLYRLLFSETLCRVCRLAIRQKIYRMVSHIRCNDGYADNERQ